MDNRMSIGMASLFAGAQSAEPAEDDGSDESYPLDNDDRVKTATCPVILPTPYLWPGKDYANLIIKDLNKLDKPFEDLLDRKKFPRMPWHDIHAGVFGDVARDLAAHFIERWNAVMDERRRPSKSASVWKNSKLNIKTDRVPIPHIFRYMKNKCKVQVLKSISSWTLPQMEKPQDSIHKAYLYLIHDAKHYIYIENQFFVSLIENHQVENNIANALCERIIRAHRTGEVFRVYIVIPLRPAFEGEIGTDAAGSTHAVYKWQYESLFRGKHSLFYKLKSAGINKPDAYVSVCSLRTHGSLENKLTTEIVYVHSKLLIVDDRKCLIGSANINDRSMLGSRDTEIALYIKDETFEPSKMNGRDYRAGRFCISLRRHLFKEFLGILPTERSGLSSSPSSLSPQDIVDPTSADFFHDVWKKTAKNNTDIYEIVFRCIPTDSVTSFAEMKTWNSEAIMADNNKSEAEEFLSDVQGYLGIIGLIVMMVPTTKNT